MSRMVKLLMMLSIVLLVISPILAQQNDTFYTVVGGDTLYRISVRFKVPMSTIIQANTLTNPQILFVGQVLRIPGGSSSLATPQFVSPNQSLSATRDAAALRYTIVRGDTLASIARRFRTTVAALAQANGITNINQIRVGQTLRIVVVGNNPAPTAAPPAQLTAVQPSIDSFTVEAAAVDRAALFSGTVRIAVAWTVSNRPANTNLVFEQVFENGTKANIELPRSNPLVASRGRGVIAPVYPPDNPNAERITLRLSLVNMSDGTYITFNTVTLPLNGAVPPQTGDVCRATMNVTTPLYSGPGAGYAVASQVAGADQFIVRARASNNWYRLDYPVSPGQSPDVWVDGGRVTLSGNCNTLPLIIVDTPTIQSFTVGVTGIERVTLGTERATLPVSWNVTNRPPRTNLLFEQVLNNGGSVNIELPRAERIVPSSGIGLVKAIDPAAGAPITSITIRLRLVNLDDQATLASQEVSIPIIASTPVPSSVEPFQEDIPVAQCYDTALLADTGVAVGKTGQGSNNLPPEGTDILTAPRNGTSIGRLSGLDKFTVLEGPACWRWLYATNWSQVVFRMWKIRIPALNNVEGWVSEFYYYGGQRTVYMQMD
jgi:LysM repeat protein